MYSFQWMILTNIFVFLVLLGKKSRKHGMQRDAQWDEYDFAA